METTGSKSDSETGPKVPPQNVDEETNIQDSRSGKSSEIDADTDPNNEIDKEGSNDKDSENKSDTDNSHISSEQLSPENN